jgi:hypothetical protein
MSQYPEHTGELFSIPDFEILADIAARAESPFAIRGGAARNLLARSFGEKEDRLPPLTSISQLVDPFSDIDLVVDDPRDIAPLLLQVYSRLAVADFLRWEVKTRRQVEEYEHTGAHTTLDGIEIVFRPDKRPTFDRSEAAVHDLSTRQLRGSVPADWLVRQDRQRGVDSDIVVLRAARFAAQFGLALDSEFLESLVRLRLPRKGPIAHYAATMLDFAALDIVFTAQTRDVASTWLHEVEEFLSEPRALSAVTVAQRLVASDRPIIHATAIPAWGDIGPSVEFSDAASAVVDGEESVVPWVPLRLPPDTDNCCRSDFRLGPLTIAWRSRDDNLIQHAEEVAPVILASPANPYEEPSRLVFAVPGIMDSGRSAVARLDWGFAQTMAGGGRLVFVGARQVTGPEAM